MNKPISVGFLPTIETDDVMLSFKLLLKPWLWKKGEGVQRLEAWFRDYFGVKYAISFNSGRAAELAVLKALGIGPGDEVLLQAFTCVAVPNSILWTGAKPVYVDIKKDHFTMDVDDLIKKISPRTKVIIIQHTFGYPDDVEEIFAVARQKKLYLIEDCAHALGTTYKGKKLGTHADAAFFSFGRDKVISSVFGGMVITNNASIGDKLRIYQEKLKDPSFFWIMKQLIYPLILTLALPLYDIFFLGKLLIEVAKQINILSLPVLDMEKRGKKPDDYPKRLPNAQALLARHQLGKIDKFIKRRIAISSIYDSTFADRLGSRNLSFGHWSLIRYPIQVSNPKELVSFAKSQNVILGRWYGNTIDPMGTEFDRVHYIKGSCLNAEESAKHIVNLPTAPTLKDEEIHTIISVVKSYYEAYNPRN